jgi:SpoVK/Ycf46/Vps4 family AAA+-type ATPase
MRMDDLSEIVFRDDAYDMLVMDRDTKDMVFALVDNSVTGAKDFIDGKGGGCIFLLAGPPGGGKTLTAEAIAEKLQRPLHMVGVGELGTNVESLEENLRRILDIASAWNAVLLIDECDIFMESRTDNDIERNAMVGVFLRLLEYYDGVLFLTSNRAGNIDEAFYSRISMSLYYDPLGVDARKTVWTNLLRVYDVKNIDVEQIAHYELNGRKIKGVIRIAKALAASENRDPTVADFTRVIDKESQFRHSIRHNVL